MTSLLKKYLKTQEKLKGLEIMYQNAIYICILDITKFADFRWKNADVSKTQGGVTGFIYFLNLL